MKINELRFGSVIRHKPSDTIGSIRRIQCFNGDYYFKISGKNLTYSIDEFDGVLVTPEILVKCGFKMSITKTCYGLITETGKSRLSVFTDGRFKVGTEDIEAEVKYLHHLQNLVYDLTGYELTLSL